MCVDGEIVDFDLILEFDKKKKYIIEVVVDCFKVCDDFGNCIVEFFEMVLCLGGDIVVLFWMNGEYLDWVFLVKYLCFECDCVVVEFELCLFLFNNFFGVCLICDGLGICSYFSVEKFILSYEVLIS